MATIQDKQLVTKADMKQAIAVALAAESQAGHPVNFSAEAVFTDLDSKQTDEQISLAKSLVAQIGLKGVPTLLLKKSVVLELGNGMNYDNFLPTAIDILRGTASHD
ncbi:Thioldisulfide interchange protein DsbA [Pseudomonas amygdali pv. lachrymans]|nr:Thioldisulfide interchange protein DsbA [Pseudomonas amygdali pv. lachrymans]KPC17895.1 Thioldisulfide interchange protein DsbA [Pseudomonas amygdali pv. lachrymans]